MQKIDRYCSAVGRQDGVQTGAETETQLYNRHCRRRGRGFERRTGASDSSHLGLKKKKTGLLFLFLELSYRSLHATSSLIN